MRAATVGTSVDPPGRRSAAYLNPAFGHDRGCLASGDGESEALAAGERLGLFQGDWLMRRRSLLISRVWRQVRGVWAKQRCLGRGFRRPNSLGASLP